MAKKSLDTGRIADACNALAHSQRSAILAYLAKNGPTTVNDLYAAVGGGSVSGISQHLDKLKGVGAVKGVRDAQRIRYDATPGWVQSLIDGLTEMAMTTEAKAAKKEKAAKSKTETATTELATAVKASMEASAKSKKPARAKPVPVKAEKKVTAPAETSPIPKKSGGKKKKAKPVVGAGATGLDPAGSADTTAEIVEIDDAGMVRAMGEDDIDQRHFTEYEENQEADAVGGGA